VGSPLVHISKTTLRHQAYEVIKNKIYSHTYKLGEKISIDSLVRELKISNTPIREALTMLEQDGLVTTNPNIGTKVVELTPLEIMELNQSIEILLSGGYDLCVAQEKTDELVSCMREHLVVQKQLFVNNDYHSLIKAAMAFDGCFITVTNNRRLITLFNSLADVFYLAVISDYQQGKLEIEKHINEHVILLDAIISKNHEKVKKLLSLHYRHGYS
jgi:Transcriptional regulators